MTVTNSIMYIVVSIIIMIVLVITVTGCCIIWRCRKSIAKKENKKDNSDAYSIDNINDHVDEVDYDKQWLKTSVNIDHGQQITGFTVAIDSDLDSATKNGDEDLDAYGAIFNRKNKQDIGIGIAMADLNANKKNINGVPGAGDDVDLDNVDMKQDINYDSNIMSSNDHKPHSDCKVGKVGKFKTIKKCYIRRPMVVIIGIETYLNLPNLVGVKKDVAKMIDLWYRRYNFTDISVVYCSNNINKNINDNDKDNNLIEVFNDSDSVKIVSNSEEFDNYLIRIRNQIDTGKNDQHIDSLIFYYTGHGVNKSIQLANGESFNINRIVSMFSGNSCKHLLDKPIIMIFDCCRGSHVEPGMLHKHKYGKHISSLNSIAMGNEHVSLQLQHGRDYDCDNYGYDMPVFRGPKQYHPNAGIEMIFSNWEGQAIVDTNKGGYLTTAIRDIFLDPNEIKNIHFADLMNFVSMKVDEISVGNEKYKIPKQVPVRETSSNKHIFLCKHNDKY